MWGRAKIGLLAGLILLCLVAGWLVFPPPAEGTSTSSSELAVGAGAPGRSASSLSPGASPTPSSLRTGDKSPGEEDIRRQLLLARVRHGLEQAWRRSASQGDFALTPGRIVTGLLEKRCGLLLRHAADLAPASANPCRSLLFALLKERLALSDDITEEKLWSVLEQVDEEYRRQVVTRLESEPEMDSRAALERFRQARRALAGPELDAKLFGLSDALLLLPSRVDGLVADPAIPAERKLAAWQELLQSFEREHQAQLASVVEPMELARLELRIHEAAGPLDPQRRQAVLEHHLGAAAARERLEHQRAQQDRDARLEAFNRERERRLQELAASGLTPEQIRQRMPELDRLLFARYGL